jgi:hypothetical protein
MRTIEDVSPRRTDALKHTFITGIVRFIRYRSLSWSAPSNDGASWYDSVTKYPEENEKRNANHYPKLLVGMRFVDVYRKKNGTKLRRVSDSMFRVTIDFGAANNVSGRPRDRQIVVCKITAGGTKYSLDLGSGLD